MSLSNTMTVTQTRPLPQKKSRFRRKKATPRNLRQSRGLTLEVGVKILINAAILTVAINALNKLIPNYRTQISRLEEVEQEVRKNQARVNDLNEEFSRNFDPAQSQIIIQQQTNQIEPNQRQIVWLEPVTSTTINN